MSRRTLKGSWQALAIKSVYGQVSWRLSSVKPVLKGKLAPLKRVPNMAEDIKNQDPENPAPSPGEQKQDVDYKAEFDKEKGEHEKTKGELDQSRTLNIILKKKLKEAGLEEEVPEAKITPDDVRKTVQEEVEKIVKPLQIQISELGKTLIAKQTVSKGGGEGGEILPEQPKPPVLSESDKKIVQKYGLKWDAKQGGWIDKNGRFTAFPNP